MQSNISMARNHSPHGLEKGMAIFVYVVRACQCHPNDGHKISLGSSPIHSSGRIGFELIQVPGCLRSTFKQSK